LITNTFNDLNAFKARKRKTIVLRCLEKSAQLFF
jgi:hypothetical protein